MSIKSQPLNTTVELEVLDIHSNSDTENNYRCSSTKSEKHKRYHHRSTKRRKSKTQSCSSLCSFTSYRSSPIIKIEQEHQHQQRSEPNVSYYVDSATGETVDINIIQSKKSTLHKSDSQKQLNCCDDGIGTAGCSYSPNTNGKNEQCFDGDSGGSPPSSNVIPIANGFKASLISVLGKLGMWNKNNSSKSARIPPQQDKGLPPGKGPPTASTKYFRGFSLTGNKILSKFIDVY